MTITFATAMRAFRHPSVTKGAGSQGDRQRGTEQSIEEDVNDETFPGKQHFWNVSQTKKTRFLLPKDNELQHVREAVCAQQPRNLSGGDSC